MVDEDIIISRFFELAYSIQIYVNSLCLPEFKGEILRDFTGDFNLNGLLITGTLEHETNVSFRNMDEFESYINATDFDYDGPDVTCSGCVYKLKTNRFKVVKRSAYANGTNYMTEIVEYHGQNCYIPTSGMCFMK